MKVLGIETSCDETAVAVVTGEGKILSHQILSQIEEHSPYGGVVPEIASRAHMNVLDHLITTAVKDAGLTGFHELSGIAVTAGPGLIGGVIVGVMMAKGLSAVSGVPIIPVNHLEGHALTIRLTDKSVTFPFLLLLVSGGHCQILKVSGVGEYERLGISLDDALGEAFDKVAKMLGLGYPGGPAVEACALLGNEKRFIFPRSMVGKPHCDFSFSGLKTAVKRQVDELQEGGATLPNTEVNDICASFQACVGDIVVDRMGRAMKLCKNSSPEIATLVLAGGVAANKYIFNRLKEVCAEYGFALKAPPIKLCTDNGAMIAWAGIEKLKLGHTSDLSFTPQARWPLC
jgi:N6-L-threonylcarbamoyladenine synthase